ncbi:MAG: hypothetical protein KIT43_03745 [Bauldia sp.]|nr:hypothetical protein [Bauldia sp.]
MPRPIPQLASAFARQAASASSLIGRLETASTIVGRSNRQARIGPPSLESIYEYAFLRVFIAWEVLLEQTFVRLMCGYAGLSGQAPLRPGRTYMKSIAAAEVVILGTKDYVLWHNVDTVTRRSNGYFVNSNFEQVLKSSHSRLEHFAALRHRIAHAQSHAEQQFDAATMALAGRRYRGARPGRFLRDWTRTSPPERWFNKIIDEMVGLAGQVCA